MTAPRIVIFAKAPIPGRVKTRLIPALGAEGAARLAASMLERTLAAAAGSSLSLELCCDPAPDHPDWSGLAAGVERSWQGEGDLGARLARAAERVTGEGAPVLLIGSDCPRLDADLLRAAAFSLADRDAVIHPAADGGYALLGLSRFHPSLFTDMAWSTAAVAEETVRRIGALGWSLRVGETLHDVDEPRDLAHLDEAMAAEVCRSAKPR